MSTLRIAWHLYLGFGPLSIGYAAGRFRPLVRLRRSVRWQCYAAPHLPCWRQWALVPLVAIASPDVAIRALRIWWRHRRGLPDPPRPARPTVALGDLFGDLFGGPGGAGEE